MEHDTLTDIAICFVVAWLFGVVAHVLRQPALLAYLVAGYVIGPAGTGQVTNPRSIEVISEIGLILLLFVIGLEIDLKRVLGSGRPILITAAIQILGGFAIALGGALMLGVKLGEGDFAALYLAVAAVLSSTVIGIKILGDKRELDTLAGRITVGILVIQDVAAIIFLGLQPALTDPSLGMVGWILLKIILLVGVALGVSKYVLPSLFHRVATLPELVTVGALAWCFIIAALADKLKLSREMGALVAGVAISTFPYHLDVTAKVSSLRDFFITLFFVGMGLMIPAPEPAALGWATLLALFVILTRFVTIMMPLRLLGMGNRVGFVTSINLLPLSEFALVILSLGVDRGHVTQQLLAPVVYAFFLLAIVGSYGILRSEQLFLWLNPWFARLGWRDRAGSAGVSVAREQAPDIYLLGCSWTASSLLEEIARTKPALLPRFAVIDFNPEVHHRLVQRGIRAIWGDISQRDTLDQAGIRRARLILCTLPNTVLRGTSNLRLVQVLRSLNREALIVAHAELLTDVPRLQEAGADHVLVTRLHDADELLEVIDAADKQLLDDKFARLRSRLESREEIVP